MIKKLFIIIILDFGFYSNLERMIYDQKCYWPLYRQLEFWTHNIFKVAIIVK
jgi:hypothetical protein